MWINITHPCVKHGTFVIFSILVNRQGPPHKWILKMNLLLLFPASGTDQFSPVWYQSLLSLGLLMPTIQLLDNDTDVRKFNTEKPEQVSAKRGEKNQRLNENQGLGHNILQDTIVFLSYSFLRWRFSVYQTIQPYSVHIVLLYMVTSRRVPKSAIVWYITNCW